MLLLVLILVLVAFGLLVVALLTGNVLSAWLSVAVSVAAAVVLVIDWLQRRSAVKAGRAGAESTSAPQPQGSHGELDPVTEVLPVYTPESDEPEVPEKRFNRVGEGQQTVVIPAVQPSGSGGRPSGAEGPSTPSGGSSSPRVTEAGAGEGGGSRADEPEGRTGSRSDDRSDAESTVVVDIRKAGIGESSAGADAPGGAAGSGEASGSKPGGIGSAVAGAAGLAGAAAVGGATKDAPPERAGADTQAVDVRKTDRPGDRADDARSPAGAGAAAASGPSKDRASEERPAGAGAPRTDDRAPAGSSSAEGRSGATPESQFRTDGAPGSRPDAERGAAAPTADGGRESRADAERGGAAPAADSGPGSRADVERGAAASAADTGPGSRPDAGRDVAAFAAGSGSEAGRGPSSVAGGGSGSRADAVRGGHSSTGDSRGENARPSDGGTGSRSDVGRSAEAASADSGPGSPPDAGRGGEAAADSGPGSRPDAGGAFTAGSGTAGSDAPPAAGGFRGTPGTGERRGGESWASGAAAGDTRPASAWATGATAASGPSTERPSEAGDTQQVDRPNGAASGSTAAPAEPPARDDQATRAPLGGATASSGHELFEPGAHEGATQQAFPADDADDAEPPEESADPALGRVAAAVEDEVLVVDEQPRYHLMGCRALAAQQTIPLPAREAVELGFTPCGWCNPVAALGARHPASAR